MVFCPYTDFSFHMWGRMMCSHRAAFLLFLEQRKAVLIQVYVPPLSHAVTPQCHAELWLPGLGNANSAMCPAPDPNGKGSFPSCLRRQTQPCPCPIALDASGALKLGFFPLAPFHCPEPQMIVRVNQAGLLGCGFQLAFLLPTALSSCSHCSYVSGTGSCPLHGAVGTAGSCWAGSQL